MNFPRDQLAQLQVLLKSSQVKSSQVKSSQIKSSQIQNGDRHSASFGAHRWRECGRADLGATGTKNGYKP
jgi:hypothetical protein